VFIQTVQSEIAGVGMNEPCMSTDRAPCVDGV